MVAISSRPASDFDTQVNRLTLNLWELSKDLAPSQRILIGISGIPGSGKSTLADRVTQSLNALHHAQARSSQNENSPDLAVNLPMDGFHYSRKHLAAMPDPKTAVHRRGAAFTFDADAFYKLVVRLREPLSKTSEAIYAPSFDHALKDPVNDSISIHPSSRIVILEGNYLSLNREPWKSAALLMHQLWFVKIDKEIARDRLACRHVTSGIVENLEAAHERIRSTDFLNADDIEQNGLEVHEIIEYK